MKISPANQRPELELADIENFDEYVEYSQSKGNTYLQRQELELDLITGSEEFFLNGYCYVCDKESRFLVDFLYANPDERIGSTALPNWRERLVCPDCQLNNRVRASIHFLETHLGMHPDSEAYMTEQTTPLFTFLDNKYPHITGSEYLGEQLPFGETNDETGIRNESITKLTFADEEFDFILSFDVFEHVPDYISAFSECLRCLKPDGVLLFTVPFVCNNESSLLRAIINGDGELQHLFEPEYHGDPVNQEGCLVFHHFGWEMLDKIRIAGFKAAKAHFFWSQELGYLGGDQILFTARK